MIIKPNLYLAQLVCALIFHDYLHLAKVKLVSTSLLIKTIGSGNFHCVSLVRKLNSHFQDPGKVLSSCCIVLDCTLLIMNMEILDIQRKDWILWPEKLWAREDLWHLFLGQRLIVGLRS